MYYRLLIATNGGLAMKLTVKEVDGVFKVIGELDDGSFYVVENVDSGVKLSGNGCGLWHASIHFTFKQVKE